MLASTQYSSKFQFLNKECLISIPRFMFRINTLVQAFFIIWLGTELKPKCVAITEITVFGSTFGTVSNRLFRYL